MKQKPLGKCSDLKPMQFFLVFRYSEDGFFEEAGQSICNGCSSHGTSFEDDLTLGAEGKWHSSLQLGLRKKLFMG